MKTLSLLALVLLMPQADGQKQTSTPAITGRVAALEPAYDFSGRLEPPTKYREWIYLTSGLDMNYGRSAAMDMQSTFDNVFVNPAAYQSFLQTGTWPDKTVLVIENRKAQSRGSINQHGNFQSTQMTGLEAHVRDEAKTPGKWAFYAFDRDQPAEQIPTTAACYSCHEQHAAVATTFVQFYPTLLPLATRQGTLSAAYLKEATAEPRR